MIEVRLDWAELLKNSFDALWKTLIVCFIEFFISALQVLIWSMFSNWFIFSSSDEDWLSFWLMKDWLQIERSSCGGGIP